MAPPLVPEFICADLTRSVGFYCDVLGFRVLYDRPAERFAYLGLDGAEIMLEQPLDRRRLYPQTELAYPYGRGMNLEIRVADVTVIVGAVVAAGLALYLPVEDRWYDRAEDRIAVRQFAVQDPDGYLLRLSQVLDVQPLTR